MTSVQVSSTDFATGTLPDVCARTGMLAKNRYRVVARAADGRPVNGAVVLHGSAAKKISLLRTVSALLLAFTVASLVIGAALGAYGLFVVTILAGVGATFALTAAGRAGIKAKVIDGGAAIELSPVADGFKLAILVPGGGGCGEDCNCGKPANEACADDHAASHTH